MRVLVGVAVAIAVYAQAPVHIQFQCTADDVETIGQNCSSTEPCAVYLELSTLDAVGPKLFITGNLHTETSTVASILFASSDGGKTWTEPQKRMPKVALDQIQFLDFETGWVAGQTVLGTPRDPFLLITHDGGKSWRASYIFEESHPGLVEQFWFESRAAGALVIDLIQAGENGVRHELFETMTGGESWTLREAGATPIRLKKFHPAANTDWRLRPDAPSKTYHVEHHESGKWVTTALFPIQVGECKEPEPKLTEAPPAETEKTDAEPVRQDEPKAPRKIPSLKKKPQ